MKLALPIEAFAAPFRAALGQASKLGVEGVAFDAVGELAPHRLSATGRREIGHLLRSHDLSLAAIHCTLRHGLDEPTDERRAKNVLKGNAFHITSPRVPRTKRGVQAGPFDLWPANQGFDHFYGSIGVA